MALERARPSVFHSARSREEFECGFVDKMDLRKGRTVKYINEPMDCRRIVVRKGVTGDTSLSWSPHKETSFETRRVPGDNVVCHVFEYANDNLGTKGVLWHCRGRVNFKLWDGTVSGWHGRFLHSRFCEEPEDQLYLGFSKCCSCHGIRVAGVSFSLFSS